MISMEQMSVDYVKGYKDKSRTYFIEKYLSTFNASEGKLTAFNLFPRQKAFLKSLSENRRSIAIKHRQAGITTVTSAWATAQMVFAPSESPETILCIGNKLDLAEQLVTKIRDFINQVPRWYWGDEYYSPDPKSLKNKKDIYTKNSKGELILFNGCRVVARSSGPNAARGISSVSILIFDEAAFIENGLEVYSSAVAATAAVPYSKIIMVSTPNGKDELYYNTYKQALSKENGYNAVEFKWFQDLRYNKNLSWYKKNDKTGEVDWLVEDVIDTKGTIKYDEDKWRTLENNGWTPTSPWYISMCQSFNNDTMKIAQELDVSFMGSANNVIAPEYIEMQSKLNVREPLTEMKDPYVDETWFWKAPIEGHRYICSCLPTGEKVLTNKGIMNIEDVSINELLIDKDGELVTINNIQTRDVVDREIVEVKLSNSFRSIKFTDNHPIWASINTKLKRNYSKTNDMYSFNERYWDFNFDFINATDLKENDWIEYPNIYYDKKELTDGEILSHWDSENNIIMLTNNFWWYCGIWLAEGCCLYDAHKNIRINTSHHIKETEIINRVYKFIENIDRTPNSTIINNVNQIHFNNNKFGSFLFENFGRYSHGKSINEWVKILPTKYKLQLVQGYLDGDGSIITSMRDGTTIKVASVSLELLEGIQDILFSLGIISSLVLNHKPCTSIIEGREVMCKEQYELSIGNGESKKFLDLCDIENNIIIKSSHKKNNCFFSKDYKKIYFKIKKITKTIYNGLVHNFETETHTYCARCIATHNCDASRGDAADRTAIEIIDMDGIDENGIPILEQVGEYLGKKTGDEIGEILYNYGTLYNNALIIIDCIGGTGDASILTLMNLGYKNLYYDDAQLKTYTIQSNFSKLPIAQDERLPGFHSKSVRFQMLSNFSMMVKNNEIKIRSVRVINELETWIFKGEQGRIDHMSGSHDDSLTCIAMALFVMQFSLTKLETTRNKDVAILKSYMMNTNTMSKPKPSNSLSIEPKNSLPFYNQRVMNNPSTKIQGSYLWLFSKRK